MSGELGAVALSVSLSMAIVLGMVIAGLVIGRQTIARRELQSAADALALAAAYSVQQNGLPLQQSAAWPFAQKNTSLSISSKFTVLPKPAETRVVVRADLVGTFDSEQSWFQRIFQIPVTSYAQVNEMIFGEQWPALSIILDASESMKQPMVGSVGSSGYDVLVQVITTYASYTLPVRNGLVVFNDMVVAAADPPTTNTNNLLPIKTALGKVVPKGRTNTREALKRAGQQLQGLDGDRNVILISDGEPTLGGACAADQPCHFKAAEQEADRVRNDVDAALFSLEIRRTNFTDQAEKFLRSIAGMPNSAGNDDSMYFVVQTAAGVMKFLIGLTRGICAYGPLTPGAGEKADAYRLRGTNPDLLGPPRRVFAYLRLTNGTEVALPNVPDRDVAFNQPGFEYFEDDTGGYVILTIESCNRLGEDPGRRLVVRWDDAQLSPLGKGSVP